jgi:hypothetical protein
MTMKKTLGVCAVLCVTAGAFGQTLSNAGNTTSDRFADNNAAWARPTPNAYAEAGRPNRNHFVFGVDVVGYWTATTKIWSSPSSHPQTINGTASFLPTRGMGGRFITQTFESDTGEQDFFGQGTFGFNNATERYEFTWIDNTTTNILFMHGTRDESGAINFSGSFVDPVTREKKTTRCRFTWPEKGRMVYEQWSTDSDGREFKCVEVAYVKTSWPVDDNENSSAPRVSRTIDPEKLRRYTEATSGTTAGTPGSTSGGNNSNTEGTPPGSNEQSTPGSTSKGTTPSTTPKR